MQYLIRTIPPHHATRPIGGTAQLHGSPGTVRSDGRAREWTGLSNSASRMVRSALDLSNSAIPASPSPDGNLKSCDPFPLPEAQAEDPTDPLTHSPSEQTAVHALLGSHQLQASHVVPGRRSVPGVCPATHIHSSFESNVGSGKTPRTSVLVFPNPWADPAQHTVYTDEPSLCRGRCHQTPRTQIEK
jgi:hypothetical protein